MPHYVGLDVSQKTTAICVVDEQGRRLWRGVCATDPGTISAIVLRHAGVDVKVGVETGSMTPWLVHGLRSAGLDVECLDARKVKAALQMRLNKTDENDAEGLAQIMRMGWYRPVHVKSLNAHRTNACRQRAFASAPRIRPEPAAAARRATPEHCADRPQSCRRPPDCPRHSSP